MAQVKINIDYSSITFLCTLLPFIVFTTYTYTGRANDLGLNCNAHLYTLLTAIHYTT